MIFHFYVFLQLYGLAAKAREYNDLLKEQVQADSDRQRVRQRLDAFLVLQFLAGPKEQRSRFQGFSLRLIAWITLVGAPILILLQAQVTFLAYHHEQSHGRNGFSCWLTSSWFGGFGTASAARMIRSSGPC